MNCKPPCMAIVIRDDYPENIGCIVEVTGASRFVHDRPAWWCITKGRPMRIIHIETGKTYMGTEADIYDADLRPIDGVPVDENIQNEVTA